MSVFGPLLNRFRARRVEAGRASAAAPLADQEFLVPNLVCEGCAEKIARALTSMPGVQDVKTKMRDKRIRVRYEPAKVRGQQLTDGLRGIGFTVLDARENS